MNENQPEKMPPVPPFVRFVASAVPMVFDDSLSYYEALCALWKYIQGMTDVINNNATLEEEYIEKFNELKTFVDTYFDNLDVQEEVNKKLDEMVEDGTFEVLIQHILDMETVTIFNTIADLKAAETINSTVVETLGFYNKGDGGGARYYITDSGTADNIFVHALDSGKYAVLANQKEFNILQIGAKRDNESDNADIFKFIFNSGLTDCTVYVPDGIYLTTTTLHPAGQANLTKNLRVIGLGEPIIKNKLPATMTKTTLGTYTGSYTVSDHIGELSFGTSCTVDVINMRDNTKFYVLYVANNTLIPDDLTLGMVLQGETSLTEAYISSIDKDDPDGAGTARIYLFETSNDYNLRTTFETSSSTLNEDLNVKLHKHSDYLYINLVDNTIPDYVAVNTQLKQTSGKSARVNSITTTFNSYNFIELNCLPKKDTFSDYSIYLDSNVDFEINEYSGYATENLILNGHDNTIIKNVIFDGGNLEINTFSSLNNAHNLSITGGCKDITFENCVFRNALMAGLQIGGMTSAWSLSSHDYPENIHVNNCQFYNCGRHDLEIINGKNITIDKCKVYGAFDIEPNYYQFLDNININNSEMDILVCYSNNVESSSSHIHISGCKIRYLSSDVSVIVDVVNSFVDKLETLRSTTRIANSTVYRMGGLNGNEFLTLANSSLYSMYQERPGGARGSTIFRAENCIIDLSIAPDTTYNQSFKEFALFDCTVCSSTKRKTISDYRTIYNCRNTSFINIKLEGGAGSLGTEAGSRFVNCEFLRIDPTTSAENFLTGVLVPSIFKDCYFEDSIELWLGEQKFINCVLNSVTKPSIYCRGGIEVSGMKTQDGSGISWAWIATPMTGKKVIFSDVEFNTSVTSPLGIKWGARAVNTDSVDMSCRGYYVGDTDKILVRLYNNSDAIGIKEISFA